MRKEIRTIKAGGQEFRVTWDMYAWHLLEKAGSAKSLDVIHCAIVAAASEDDKPVPVTLAKLGGMFATIEERDVAVATVWDVAKANGFTPDGADDAGKEKAPAPKASQQPSGAATSSQPSTLELATANSGE